MLLPDDWRKLKLLSDNSTEHLERSLTIFRTQPLPEAVQGNPLAGRQFRRKKNPSCRSRMTFLLESCGDGPRTNEQGSKMQKQTITEIWARRHSSLLGAFYVYCFWGDRVHLDRFFQAYSVEKTHIEARRQGFEVYEQPLSDGSIKLTVCVGGAT